MRIRDRIFGGFILILLLTLAVASVGWTSLTRFGARVDGASAAQTLLRQTSELALAADRAGTEDKNGVDQALADLRLSIKALAETAQSDPAALAATTRMNASTDAFEAALERFSKQRAARRAMLAAHKALVDEFQSKVETIAQLQKTNLDAAAEAVQKCLTDQSALNVRIAAINQAIRSTYELEAQQQEFLADGAPEHRAKMAETLHIVGLLVESLLDAGEAVQVPVKAGLAKVEAYSAAVAAATDPDKRTDLLPLAEALMKSLRGIELQMGNDQSLLETQLSDTKYKIDTGTRLLALASSAIVAARKMADDETALNATGTPENAKVLDAAASELFKITQVIYFSMQGAAAADIKAFLAKLEAYRASIAQSLEAERLQKELRLKLTDSLAAVRTEAQSIQASEQARMGAERNRALMLLLGGVAGAVALGLGLALVIGRGITRPLAGLASTMAALSNGRLDTMVDATERRDEIGAMARTVQVFKDNACALSEATQERKKLEEAAALERARAEAERAEAAQAQAMVVESVALALDHLSRGELSYRIEAALAPDYVKLKDDFNAAMSQLQRMMSIIAGATKCIHSGTGEITQAADDLSRRTEQQAASLEQTAASLAEITTTMRKTADAAREASHIVSDAQTDAMQSGEVVAAAVQAMSEIEKSAQEISQIIGVIDEIAFQTNLLALNAGVEAARAGDAGRGFAVVASEVRGLAQRSAEAAREIKTLISASSAQVDKGVDLVGETGKALERIVTQWNKINQEVSQIASSANEQATGLNEVHVAVTQMDHVTQQNAAMVEETTAASHALAQEADQLSGLVDKFKIEDNVVPMAPGRAVPARRAVAPLAHRSGGAALATRPHTAAQEEWEEF